MNRESTHTLYVYSDFPSKEHMYVGKLFFSEENGKECIYPEYDRNFLKSRERELFDPSLKLFNSPDIFTDSLPDSWGIKLLKHTENNNGLYGSFRFVDDGLRKGAFLFTEQPEYITDNKAGDIPSEDMLTEFSAIAEKFENNEEISQEHLYNFAKNGASLGGSRPKINVRGKDNSLWIAKLPGRNDTYDKNAWEYVASLLAGDAGILVPEVKLIRCAPCKSIFLTKRFDRTGEKHIHFISAYSLLDKTDDGKCSYLDMVKFIKSSGCRPEKNLNELFRQMVFRFLISDTDNHLKNTGFILSDEGWELCPLFDINPSPDGKYFSVGINENLHMPEIKDLTDTAKYFGIKKSEAERIITGIKNVIRENARIYASAAGISETEYERMKPAFIKC